MSELISCTTTQNKIHPNESEMLQGTVECCSIQHCENCVAISSHYTTTKVLLDSNLLIKQQPLIKAKKLICSFYSQTLPSVRFPNNKNASRNAISQNFWVNAYNKSILLVTSKQSNKNYLTPKVAYLKQQTENSSFGAKLSNSEWWHTDTVYNFHTLTKSIGKHCTFKNNTRQIRITCNNMTAKAFVKYSHEMQV